MHKGFFAEVLASRPTLWNAMLRANTPVPCSLDCMAEASRILGSSAVPLSRWLAEGEGTVSRSVIATDDGGFWDYAEESRRLALLDRTIVNELCRVTGVALHAPEVAHVLLKEEQLALRQHIGEGMYRYALYRGQFQLGSVRRIFVCLHEVLPLADRCFLHGNMALRLVAGCWPESLHRRFLRHLDPLPEGACLPALQASEIREIWLALKKLLLKEVAPAWAPNFD